MLVVRFTESSAPYNAGETAGFPDHVAMILIGRGTADVCTSAELVTVEQILPEPPESTVPSDPGTESEPKDDASLDEAPNDIAPQDTVHEDINPENDTPKEDTPKDDAPKSGVILTSAKPKRR